MSKIRKKIWKTGIRSRSTVLLKSVRQQPPNIPGPKYEKALPTDYAYVIEELITEKAEVLDKEAYYDSIVNTIIEIGSAENFIIALAELIQRLVVDHLHILGIFMTEVLLHISLWIA